MGNPLINELLIGTGFKDRFSMDQPKNDAQFASFFLDPALARVVNALTGGARRDSRAAATGSAAARHVCAADRRCRHAGGPIADLLRLNTGVRADARGLDQAGSGCSAATRPGIPNGRRLYDDVVGHRAAVVVGGVLAAAVPRLRPNITALGDGVNVNDAPYRTDVPVSGERAERPRPASHRSGRAGVHRGHRRAVPALNG